jgi:hypothetical protein
MTTRLTLVYIPVPPWFADHFFNGRIVLPAVECMALLAAEIARTHPEIDIRLMEHVRFTKFLEIPEGSTTVTALIEQREKENGSIQAILLRRVQYKAVRRLKEYAEILFSPARTDSKIISQEAVSSLPGPVREVAAKDVYRELIPLGPSYHTLQETLYLAGEYARGRLLAPDLPAVEGVREILGSPFPLDGAFHAACVLGQCFVDFVPLPVGFARRTIYKPTRPGGSYLTRVELISRKQDELIFDLSIFDEKGEIHENVTGLRMRDVSRGGIKPPEWIKMKNET